MLDPFFVWMRNFHDRHARTVLASIAALMLPLMVMTTVATLDNWRQDKDRDRLLMCFDEFAEASSTSSSVVREKSQAKDDAVAVLNAALSNEGDAFLNLTVLLRRSLAGKDVDPAEFARVVKRLANTLAARQDANAAVIDAQAALDKARDENPVPPPPSKFCN